MSTTFTPQQLSNFKRYLDIQKRGRYNMFDPRARQLTGLERDDYIFVMDNYEALAKAATVADAGRALEQAYPFGYRSEGGP